MKAVDMFCLFVFFSLLHHKEGMEGPKAFQNGRGAYFLFVASSRKKERGERENGNGARKGEKAQMDIGIIYKDEEIKRENGEEVQVKKKRKKRKNLTCNAKQKENIKQKEREAETKERK